MLKKKIEMRDFEETMKYNTWTSDYINKKGITLIALIITIIILLILAGVTVNLLIGNEGLLKRTESATEMAKKEEGREIIRIAVESLRVDCVEKKIPLTLDYIGDNIADELKIDSEDVTKNGDPVETVNVIYNDYEYEINDKFEIAILGSRKGRVYLTLEYKREVEKGKITVVARTTDKEGIKRIIKPDGTEEIYTNKEQEVTLNYEVDKNGDYEFIAEGNNGESRTKRIKILGFDYFSVAFGTNDFLNINQCYAKGKETKTEEQNKIINDTNALIENNNTINAVKNTTDNTWTLVGQSKTQLLSNYYLYDVYGVDTKMIYEEGEWGPWSEAVSFTQLMGHSCAYGSLGWDDYSFDSTSGNFTVLNRTNKKVSVIGQKFFHDCHAPSSSAGVIQNLLLGRTLREFEYLNHGGLDSSKNVKYREKVAVEKEQNTVTTLEGEIISIGGVYPDDGLVKIGNHSYKKYKKKNQVKQYNIYKYVDNEVKTSYNVESGTINTKRIELFENNGTIKIALKAIETNYQLSISNDNSTWIPIQSSLLNGQSEINLGSPWDCIYIQIKRNSSSIQQIEVL